MPESDDRTDPPLVSAPAARRVFLRLQGLADAPVASSPAAVRRLVRTLGYVQIDSINVLDRAHHLILGTRLEGYRPEHLAHELERSRRLFEQWTHDASAIPIEWMPHWRVRYERTAREHAQRPWWRARLGGDPDAILKRTIERVRKEGPLRARDVGAAPVKESERWWGWRPEKAALEHLWRIGKLAVVRRERFEKVYDLSERVHGDAIARPASDLSGHDDWACREAVARLGIATERGVAAFFRAAPIDRVRAWCEDAIARGELVRVRVEPQRGGRPIRCVARPDWRRLAKELDESRIVPLCPFDPTVRDRDRTLRLFGFDYRFEAFTPAAKRRFGYYVLPLLEGDRLIGRIDPSFDRANGTLLVRGPWWEPNVRMDAARRRRLHASLDRLAAQVGAARWTLDRPRGGRTLA